VLLLVCVPSLVEFCDSNRLILFDYGGEKSIRHDVGGYYTCLSRRIPGIFTPELLLFMLFFLVNFRSSKNVNALFQHNCEYYETKKGKLNGQ
jgi:hypothetical protein